MSSNSKLTLYVTDAPEQPSRYLTREGVDMVNSIAWLSMDALWLFAVPKVGLLFGIPSIISGLLLLYVERKKPLNFMYLSLNCWVWMNVTWMISDTFPQYETPALITAKSFLILGLIFVGIGAMKTGKLSKALATYKGYKQLKLNKTKPVQPV